jgi:16S rRNA (adenine1518-N6/adenine1519-N6)-dimethyltransferase
MVKPKKFFGQHFLKSRGVVEKIADAVEISPDDTVVEIGPGTGALTEELLKRNPKRLVALEIDPEMVSLLKEKFSPFKNFELLNADATKVDFCSLSEGKPLKVVGNLPYNVGSLIVLNTVYGKDCIDRAVYMLQKEVAERLTLKHRKPSWLGIFLNTFFDTEYLMSVPARFFYPPPKVTSAVIKLTPKEKQPKFKPKGYQTFLEKLFSNRRKMLKTKIDEKLLREANINPTARVEELKLEDFIRLYEKVREERKG